MQETLFNAYKEAQKNSTPSSVTAAQHPQFNANLSTSLNSAVVNGLPDKGNNGKAQAGDSILNGVNIRSSKSNNSTGEGGSEHILSQIFMTWNFHINSYNSFILAWARSDTRCAHWKALKVLNKMWELHQDGHKDVKPDLHAFGWRGKLAAILLLDQVSRHIHRHCREGVNAATSTNVEIPKQAVLDGIAFQIAKSIQCYHSEEIRCGMVPVPMLIFALMPYRHASTLQSVGFVQQRIQEIASLNSIDMENMICRFR